MSKSTHNCICCGRDVPAHQFRPGFQICALCATMAPNDVALSTAATFERRRVYLSETVKGKREARQIAKLDAYNATGKRCSACHHYKPVEHYGACATRGDGLQANCKQCNKLRLAIVSNGGSISQWHHLRDTLRSTATPPAVGPNAALPAKLPSYIDLSPNLENDPS